MSVEDRCVHEDCGFENRAEYCEIEAARPESDAYMVVEMLEALLTEHVNVPVDDKVLSADSYTLSRSFSRKFGRPGRQVPIVIDIDIVVRRLRGKSGGDDKYEVVVDWKPLAQGELGESFTRGYSMSTGKDGIAQALIDEPSLEGSGRVTRKMTPYDCLELFEELYACYENLSKAGD